MIAVYHVARAWGQSGMERDVAKDILQQDFIEKGHYLASVDDIIVSWMSSEMNQQRAMRKMSRQWLTCSDVEFPEELHAK